MPKAPDCRQASLEYLRQAKNIVIKIGSAVLTNTSSLNHSILSSLAAQIARVRSAVERRNVVIVSSGAVAAGRGMLAKYGRRLDNPTQTDRQALAAIGQGLLIHAWHEAFKKHGILTAQALLTRDDFHHRERFQHASDTFAEMLAWGILPIVNENDTVAIHELHFGDNDTLASLLVNLIEADLFINLTSAPGVFAENPEKTANARVLPCIDNIAELNVGELCGSKTQAGSGGMYSKLLAARRVAQIGVPTLILPGRKPDVLLDAFEIDGERNPELVGTWICADQKAIPRRKFWLAYQSEPVGEVEIDTGAAQALIEKGSSLLPGGIKAVSGFFQIGDLVRIRHKDTIIGVGFSNYAASELEKIHGRKRHEIAAILGLAKYPDVIHRDNLLLDAVISTGD